MKFTYASGSRPLDGYTVKRGVGHGGFGEVYYAVSDGGKEVALKLVQRNLDVELRGVAQCMNLKHPNLVTLYDLRTNDAGEHFVIMEYVSGKGLAQVLEEHPQALPPEEVNRWFRGICAGVGYLHDKGIVHRDLKPGNLFIEDGVVKVGDYGLSKFITTSRRSGQTESVGTVHYMAPEISRGKYDREIDIYSMGIILYEMLTGDVPFDGESVGEILMKHLTAQPDVSRLPPPYDAIVTQALAKDPAARFRSMETMFGSLNGQLGHSAATPPLRPTLPYVQTSEAAPGSAGHAQAPTAAKSATARAAAPEIDKCANWFSRKWSKVIAWYERPWRVKDYLLAVLLGIIAVATAKTAAMGSILALLPGAILVAGVALIVMKVTGWKPAAAVMGAAAPSPPVVLTPMNASPPTGPAATSPPSPPAGGQVTPVSGTASLIVAPPSRTVPPPRPMASRETPPKLVRTRLAEATSAMLMTTVLSVITSVLVAGLMRLHVANELALLALTTLVGCWAVVIPGKIWEGHPGDAMVRRLVMAALGLGVGLWSSYLDEVLKVHWFNDPTKMTPVLFETLDWMPRLVTNASYFGLVFLIPRWWLLVDSRRPLKLNPWMVIVPCFWAWVISLLWTGKQFDGPPPWGVIVSGMVAVLVQLASPWEDPAVRRRMI